jgi:hypothetical protein
LVFANKQDLPVSQRRSADYRDTKTDICRMP